MKFSQIVGSWNKKSRQTVKACCVQASNKIAPELKANILSCMSIRKRRGNLAVAYTAFSAACVNYVLFILSYNVYNFRLQILSNILGICVQL